MGCGIRRILNGCAAHQVVDCRDVSEPGTYLHAGTAVRYLFIKDNASQFHISAMCRVLRVSARNPAQGLIHHSDRGVQYACGDYQRVITRAGMRPSMSRKGDCWDNSVAESFFSTLRKDMIYHVSFETRKAARRDIFDFIEVFYNRRRLHSYLGYMSPVEFETAATKAA